MTAELIALLHALVDAAFKGGTLTDAKQVELHGVLDAHQNAQAEAPAEPADVAVPPQDEPDPSPFVVPHAAPPVADTPQSFGERGFGG